MAPHLEKQKKKMKSIEKPHETVREERKVTRLDAGAGHAMHHTRVEQTPRGNVGQLGARVLITHTHTHIHKHTQRKK